MAQSVEAMGSEIGNEEPQSIIFNVGGKIYEVSTSLLRSIPNTSILAKKASEAQSYPIFIDRDPDRFAYCLDYMRDKGRVHLADNVSKESLLAELQFFGFENVDESLIQYDATAKRQTGARFQKNLQQSLRELANMRNEVKSLQGKIDMGELALHCLRESSKSVYTSEMEFRFGLKNGPFPNLHHLSDKAYFAECCERNGLHFVKCVESSYVDYLDVVLRFADRAENCTTADE